MEQAPVGTVEFISPHRDFGFIRVKYRGKLYFRMEDAPSEIELKDPVTFRQVSDPEQKHDRAVDIQIVADLAA